MFDFSSFFGGSSSGGFGLSSINFSDYHMIKSGSYKKLMRAYYTEQGSESTKTSASAKKTSKSDGKSVVDKIIGEKMHGNIPTKDSTGLAKMQTQADALKTAAEAFGDADVFRQEDGNYDTDKMLKSVNDFVNKYNSTLDQAGKVTSADVAGQVGYMKSMTSTMSKELEKIGITVGEDGKLSVNEDVLKNAHMADVEAVFSGAGSYAGEIAEKAGSIQSAAFRSSSLYSSDGTVYSSSTSTYSNQV